MTIHDIKPAKSRAGNEYVQFAIEMNVVGGGRIRQTGWRYYVESEEVVEPRTLIGGAYLKTTSALDHLRERIRDAIKDALCNPRPPARVLSPEDVAGIARVAREILASSDRAAALGRLGEAPGAADVRNFIAVHEELQGERG